MTVDESTLVRRTSPVWGSALALRAGWSRWQRRSTTRKVLAAQRPANGAHGGLQDRGGRREVVTAYWFGTGDALDAFVVAFTIPTFAAMALGNAAGSALLPTLTQVRQRSGRQAANQLLRESSFWTLVLLLAACMLLGAGATWLLELVSPGFEPWKQALARELMLILIPVVVLRGVISLYTGVLNSQERFAASGVVPVLTPLISIALMFALGGRLGIRALAWGMLAGSLAEAVAIGWSCARVAIDCGPVWLVRRRSWCRPSGSMYRWLSPRP